MDVGDWEGEAKLVGEDEARLTAGIQLNHYWCASSCVNSLSVTAIASVRKLGS